MGSPDVSRSLFGSPGLCWGLLGAVSGYLLSSHGLSWLHLAAFLLPNPFLGLLGSPGLSWALFPGTLEALMNSPGFPWPLLNSPGPSLGLLGSPGTFFASPGLSWALLGSLALS